MLVRGDGMCNWVGVALDWRLGPVGEDVGRWGWGPAGCGRDTLEDGSAEAHPRRRGGLVCERERVAFRTLSAAVRAESLREHPTYVSPYPTPSTAFLLSYPT